MVSLTSDVSINDPPDQPHFPADPLLTMLVTMVLTGLQISEVTFPHLRTYPKPIHSISVFFITGKGGHSSVHLVEGDVTQTCEEFVKSNPGFRISYLHMDLDVEVPTLKALEALWPCVVRGGIVVFDEYAIQR